MDRASLEWGFRCYLVLRISFGFLYIIVLFIGIV
jgi:hypothetical protein